ncbi:plasmid mobilization protein [Galbibacter sp.]|uniref:plasmid mobilization protein n=1 Tax=Galbibacter sp. TaxID=2918471 RepID=UPI003A937663
MELDYDNRKKDGLVVERKPIPNKIKLQLSSEVLRENDTITPEFDNDNSVLDMPSVPVAAKENHTKKKRLSKNRNQSFRIGCSAYEKKLLKLIAKRSGLSVSELFRRAVFRVEVKERMSDQHIEIYKNLVLYHNNLKSAAYLVGEKDPKFTKGVNRLAGEIKALLLNITK